MALTKKSTKSLTFILTIFWLSLQCRLPKMICFYQFNLSRQGEIRRPSSHVWGNEIAFPEEGPIEVILSAIIYKRRFNLGKHEPGDVITSYISFKGVAMRRKLFFVLHHKCFILSNWIDQLSRRQVR